MKGRSLRAQCWAVLESPLICPTLWDKLSGFHLKNLHSCIAGSSRKLQLLSTDTLLSWDGILLIVHFIFNILEAFQDLDKSFLLDESTVSVRVSSRKPNWVNSSIEESRAAPHWSNKIHKFCIFWSTNINPDLRPKGKLSLNLSPNELLSSSCSKIICRPWNHKPGWIEEVNNKLQLIDCLMPTSIMDAGCLHSKMPPDCLWRKKHHHVSIKNKKNCAPACRVQFTKVNNFTAWMKWARGRGGAVCMAHKNHHIYHLYSNLEVWITVLLNKDMFQGQSYPRGIALLLSHLEQSSVRGRKGSHSWGLMGGKEENPSCSRSFQRTSRWTNLTITQAVKN